MGAIDKSNTVLLYFKCNRIKIIIARYFYFTWDKELIKYYFIKNSIKIANFLFLKKNMKNF